jgi:hypothetical protein
MTSRTAMMLSSTIMAISSQLKPNIGAFPESGWLGVDTVEFWPDGALGVVVEAFVPTVMVCVLLQSLVSPLKTLL